MAAALRQRQLLRQRKLLARALGDDGTEPGSWDDWEDEGELAAASSPAAAAWAGWYSSQQGQGGAAAARGDSSSSMVSSDCLGRQGETQQLEASTSGRDQAQGQQRQQRQQSAGTQGGFSPAPAPQHRWQDHQSSSSGAGSSRVDGQLAQAAALSRAIPPPPPRPSGVEARFFTLGAVAAVALHYLINFAGTLPVVRSMVQRFVWWSEPKGPALPPTPPGASTQPGSGDGAGGTGAGSTALAVQYSEDAESVEWVNMCWRKVSCAGWGLRRR